MLDVLGLSESHTRFLTTWLKIRSNIQATVFLDTIEFYRDGVSRFVVFDGEEFFRFDELYTKVKIGSVSYLADYLDDVFPKE